MPWLAGDAHQGIKKEIFVAAQALGIAFFSFPAERPGNPYETNKNTSDSW
jgi:hypothetical protein